MIERQQKDYSLTESRKRDGYSCEDRNTQTKRIVTVERTE